MGLPQQVKRLERQVKALGLDKCPECRRRLRCEVPVTRTDVFEGEPMPEPDCCPKCGVEWPRLVMSFSGANPDGLVYSITSPLSYDPVFRR